MDGNNQPQQPFQPAPGPAPQPVMPPQPAPQQPQPFQPAPQPMQPQPPFGAPVNPMGPVGPVGQPPMGAPYQMPPKKGLSRGALWGVIGGSIASVLVIIGVILAVIFLSGPNRDDYLALQSQVKDIREQHKKISKALLPHAKAVFNGTQSDGSLKEALEKYTTGVNKLKDQPALKDKEVKQSYEAFLKEAEAVKSYTKAFVDAEDTAIASYKKCDGSSQAAAARLSDPRARIVALRDAAKECANAIGKITDSKSEKIADYGKVAQKAYDDQASIFDDAIKAIDARDRLAYESAQRRLQSQASDFRKIQVELGKLFDDTKTHEKMPKLEALEDSIETKLKS